MRPAANAGSTLDSRRATFTAWFSFLLPRSMTLIDGSNCDHTTARACASSIATPVGPDASCQRWRSRRAGLHRHHRREDARRLFRRLRGRGHRLARRERLLRDDGLRLLLVDLDRFREREALASRAELVVGDGAEARTKAGDLADAQID